MKRFLVKAIVPCFILVFAIPAWSLTITDVEQVDLYKASTDLGPGANPAAEEAWAEDELGGIDLTFLFKVESGAQNWVQLSDDSSIFAREVSTPYPLYFIYKSGAPIASGPYVGHRQFLFQNISAYNYLVVDLEALGYASEKWTVEVFSHTTGFTPVPEPGTMMLLGSGLIGLAGWGRKKFRK